MKRLLRLVTDSMKNCVDMIAPYADGLRMADPVASPALISPKYFRELVYPYLVEIMEYADGKIGQKPSLHICGNTRKVWDYFREMPIRAISLDNIMDLEEAKQELGGRMTIVGNILRWNVSCMARKRNFAKKSGKRYKSSGKSKDISVPADAMCRTRLILPCWIAGWMKSVRFPAYRKCLCPYRHY